MPYLIVATVWCQSAKIAKESNIAKAKETKAKKTKPKKTKAKKAKPKKAKASRSVFTGTLLKSIICCLRFPPLFLSVVAQQVASDSCLLPRASALQVSLFRLLHLVSGELCDFSLLGAKLYCIPSWHPCLFSLLSQLIVYRSIASLVSLFSSVLSMISSLLLNFKQERLCGLQEQHMIMRREDMRSKEREH